MFKSGFIAIIGRPNAGKSTLINRFVGEKVSIVTWRPQTTRNKILGIINGDDYQAVFIDTPGIHNASNKLSEYMLKSIYNSLQDVDAIVYLIDGSKYITDQDKEFLEKYSVKTPLIIALNKVDDVVKERYVETLNRLNEFNNVKSIYSISARRGDNCEELKAELISLLPEGQIMYPNDIYTDRTLRFMVAEIVREKALMLLDEEIPYGISVVVNKFEQRHNKDLIDIDADIICERTQHKSIIIGRQGSKIKVIGEKARLDIERLIDSKVFLNLFVKVEDNWRDKPRLLEDLGYDKKTL